MSESGDNKLVSAQLERVPWWRAAFDRIGKNGRHRATLDRLAERDADDTIGEADVRSWLAMLEGETRRQSASGSSAPSARRPRQHR